MTNKNYHVDYENKMKLILSKSCIHKSNYGNITMVCKSACTEINNALSKNYKFSQIALQYFVEYITTPDSNYYIYKFRLCILENPKMIVDTITKIIKSGTIPNVSTMCTMIMYESFDECFVELVKNPNFAGFDNDFIKFSAINRFEHDCLDKIANSNNYNIVDALFNNCDIDKNYALFLNSRNIAISERLSAIIYKVNGLTNELFKKACKSLPYTKLIVTSFLNIGFAMTNDIFNVICNYCDEDSIKYILTETRIEPTKKHFKSILESYKYIPKKIFNNKSLTWKYRNDTIRYEKCNDKEIIEKIKILLKYGYVPDYDDIIYAAKNKIELPNIEKFNIKLDEKLLKVCWENEFYPNSYKFDSISNEMLELQKLCLTRQKAQIRQFMKKYNVVPDNKCMENASKFKNNLQILEILINKGGKINYECIKNCANQLKSNRTLMFLINEYEKNYKKQIETYENLLKKYNITDLDDKKDTEVKAEAKAETKVVTEDVIEVETEVETEDETEEDTELEIINIYDIQDKDVKYIPKNKRKNDDMPIKYSKYFKLKKKQISFYNLRKDFLNRIKKNKWFKIDNQMLLKLPNKLYKLLKINIDSDSYLHIKDLDKLICLFYDQ